MLKTCCFVFLLALQSSTARYRCQLAHQIFYKSFASIDIRLDLNLGYEPDIIPIDAYLPAASRSEASCLCLGPLLGMDRYRCESNMMHRIRAAKVSWLGDFFHAMSLVSEAFESYPMIAQDGINFGFTYAFEAPAFTSDVTQTRTKRVCSFGGFSLDLVHLLLTSDNVHQLVVVDDQMTSEEQYMFDEVSHLYRSFGLLVSMLEPSALLQKKETGQFHCNYIHVRGGGEQELVALVSMFATISDRTDLSSIVVWEKFLSTSDTDHRRRHEATSALVDWSAFYPFAHNSRLQQMESTEGFFAKQFGIFLGVKLSLAEVWLGRARTVQAPSQLLPAPQPCHVTGFVTKEELKRFSNRLESSLSSVDGGDGGDWKNEITIVITYTVRIFEENAFGFQQALTDLGFDNVLVMGDFTLEDVELLKSAARPCAWTSGCARAAMRGARWTRAGCESGGSLNPSMIQASQSQSCSSPRLLLQLVLGSHEAALLLPNYIVFQTEQQASLLSPNLPPHLNVLQGASHVLVFSSFHRVIMQGLGISRSSAVPMYVALSRLAESAALNRRQALLEQLRLHPDESQSWVDPLSASSYLADILFFGGLSDRRRAVFNATLPGMSSAVRTVIVTGTMKDMVFDDERDDLVIRSKVVVNFHGTNQASLNVHRINYLLALGKCVVSERSETDPQLDEEYSEAVVFVDNVFTIFDVAASLALDDSRRLRMELKAFEKGKAISQDLRNLHHAVKMSVVHVLSS